jgi:transposase
MSNIKFNELTDEDKRKIYLVYIDKTRTWDDRITELMFKYNKSERTIRRWLKKLNFKERSDKEPEEYIKAKTRKINKNKKRYLITWCQNNTPIHQNFLHNLESYAKHIDADIHVILGRYKNPTSVFSDKDEEFWDEKILKYSDANRHDIHKYLSIMSDIKIQPTAVLPLRGLHSMSGENSCIFGSPKMQMEVIPVLNTDKPKIMFTTGAISQKNYTDSKAGKIGEFHHVIGFCVVEIENENDLPYVRQVSATDDGSFCDLCYEVKNGEINITDEIEGIVLGDIHFGSEDDVVMENTDLLIEILKPKHIILHDIFDGKSINHHEDKDPFIQYAKEVKNENSLGDEINYMLEKLEIFEEYSGKKVIVRSNHDDFLDRWLKNGDWKKQPTFKNSALYMKYSAILLEQYANDESPKGIIPHLINEKFPDFICLNLNDSYKIHGYECANHGHISSNGSKGSATNFVRLSTKMIIAHSHTPLRRDGILQVGTSTKLKLSYNKGPSSWLHSHVIIHKNGKAQHIIFLNSGKKFTTFF